MSEYQSRFLTTPEAPPMPVRRRLPDGCLFCGGSLVLCDCIRDLDNMPCCAHCSHGRAR